MKNIKSNARIFEVRQSLLPLAVRNGKCVFDVGFFEYLIKISKIQDSKNSRSHFAPPTSRISNSGQIAVVLLLFVLVALTIGLTVTQRSLTNISTSSQTEQVSRAFSAAEAGLERSLNQTPVIGPSPAPGSQDLPLSGAGSLNNQSSTQVKVVTSLPNSNQQALEYPPVGKDTFAQFWIANPNTLAASNLTAINVY